MLSNNFQYDSVLTSHAHTASTVVSFDAGGAAPHTPALLPPSPASPCGRAGRLSLVRLMSSNAGDGSVYPRNHRPCFHDKPRPGTQTRWR